MLFQTTRHLVAKAQYGYAHAEVASPVQLISPWYLGTRVQHGRVLVHDSTRVRPYHACWYVVSSRDIVSRAVLSSNVQFCVIASFE